MFIFRFASSSTEEPASACTSSSTASTSTDTQQHPPLRIRSGSRDYYHQADTASHALQNPRRRTNSRDIPRTYSGLYGVDNDLVPFEVSRHTSLNKLPDHLLGFLGAYATSLFCVHVLSVLLVGSFSTAWTLTNAIHLVVSLVFMHGLKGSLSDEQGEMSALTAWEQLEATNGTRNVRRILAFVPTIVCYAACYFAQFDAQLSSVNVAAWAVLMLAKMPFMNGVRILGINRTAGIDDDDDSVEGSSDPLLYKQGTKKRQ